MVSLLKPVRPWLEGKLMRKINSPKLMLAALCALAAPAAAQAQSSERLLDSLIRGMQICSEINDSANRLACYDEVSRTASGQPHPGNATPIAPAPGYVPSAPAQGDPYQSQGTYPPPVDAADRAFDPSAQRTSTVPPEMVADVISERRSGPGPIPRGNVSLLSLGTPALNYNEANYRWMITAPVTNNTNRIIDASITCTLTNNGRTVTDINWFPNGIRPGETVIADILGPPTSVFSNGVTCRVNSPI